MSNPEGFSPDSDLSNFIPQPTPNSELVPPKFTKEDLRSQIVISKTIKETVRALLDQGVAAQVIIDAGRELATRLIILEDGTALTADKFEAEVQAQMIERTKS